MKHSTKQTEPSRKKGLSFTGERLVQDQSILKPQRVENLARFNFFTKQLSGGKVLDYGCGAGEGTCFLNQLPSYQVFGLDLSLLAVKYARQSNIDRVPGFVCGDVLFPSFKKGSFDGIISVEVIEHIIEAGRFLENISLLIKPEGICMLTTPNSLISSPKASSLWPDHVREYQPAELIELCSRYFSEVRLYGQFIPIYEENPLRKFIHKLAPIIKPILPKWLRIRALPMIFSFIKSDLEMDEVEFTTSTVHECPTLVVVCSKPILPDK